MTTIKIDVRADETQTPRGTATAHRKYPARHGRHRANPGIEYPTAVCRSRDPDGLPWKELSAVTLSRRRKAGSGAQILRDTGRLASGITYKVVGGSVELGTNVVYAGTHQYGAKKGGYGRTRKGGPIPWGDIPARPFFGYNDQDQADVLELFATIH